MPLHASRIALVVAVAGSSLAAGTTTAGATSDQIRIREVFAGVAGAPTAQFVELQSSAPLQNQVGGKQIRVFDASGALVDTFTFAAPVPVLLDQSTVLVATPAAESFFGVEADLEMDAAAIGRGGGKLCYFDPAAGRAIDCLAWGSYAGSAAGVGAPFNAAEGFPAGAAVERSVSGGTDPTALDASDDTDESAADFRFAAASPRNNLGAAGAAPGGALSFATASTGTGEGDGTLAVALTRSGGAGTITAGVLLRGGTATPGTDFALVDDTLELPPAAAAQLSVVDDLRAEADETVRLALRDPGGGAVLGPPIDAVVTIDDDDSPDTEPPLTTIARPGHGGSYRPAKLRAFRGHSADVGSDVALVEIALRQKRTNGDCRWWNGERFVPRPCGLKLFQTAGSDASWRYAPSKRLKPSVGTNVRDYTLFARAVDTANNLETALEAGRNRNRFEVT
ncbi:MAG TPA: hypothetical protein VHL78_03355 [Actinomycetota bacterium]|nr:hypothetical protein [Actinomycetota bacterium]